MPFLGGKTGFTSKKPKESSQKKTKQNKQKTIRRVQDQVRWPFGQPHLTLKPSKKQKQNKQDEKKQITDKEGLGPSEVARNPHNKNQSKKTHKKNKRSKHKKNN